MFIEKARHLYLALLRLIFTISSSGASISFSSDAVTIPEVIYAFYALNQLGAISNMVDPRTSERGIQKYILESKARYILTLDILAEKIQGAIRDTSIEKMITVSATNSFVGVRGIIFDIVNTKSHNVKNVLPWKKFINNRNKVVEKSSYRKNKCCVIVHTGGTTGSPKGVMLTDDNLNAMVINAKASEGDYEIGNKFLNIMPPFIAYGLVNGIHMILSCGMENILIPQFKPVIFPVNDPYLLFQLHSMFSLLDM